MMKNYMVVSKDMSDGRTLKISSLKTANEGYRLFMEILKKQESEDFLGLGKTGVVDTQTDGVYVNAGGISTFDNSHATSKETSPNSMVIYGDINKKDTEVKEVLLDGVNTGIRLGISAFVPGFVIATGKEGFNILGARYTSFLNKITSRNIKTCAKSGATVFKDPAAIKKYVESHRDVFSFCVRNYSYHWYCEPVNDIYKQILDEGLASDEKKNKKYVQTMNELETLFSEINDILPTVSDADDGIPEDETATPVQQKSEAVRRMKEFGLYAPVIRDLDRDKLYMSEAGGILYDLNDDAQAAAQIVKDDFDGFPYHIIRSYTDFGECYSVLFVSKYTEEWEEDRSRTPMAYVYNATHKEYSELGHIGIVPANGGLVRTD